ncbi:glutathione S-transferase [Hypomontagnella submonticulosa]|nr:glutathione S-transferase [Hypomontagnella submonticulosa]
MSFGKISSYPGNFRALRPLAVAALGGLDVSMDDDFKMGVTNKTPEFLAKFPMGKVPVLECADGFCLAEGGAICYYLARAGSKAQQLLGGDAKTEALIQQWVFLAETDLSQNILPPAGMVIFKVIPWDENRYNYCAANTERALKRIEVALQGKQYLVGDQITLADIMVAGPLFFGSKFLIDAEMRKEVPNVVAWLQRLAAMPEFKAFGDLVLCETRTKA